jgi:hypothetical protein
VNVARRLYIYGMLAISLAILTFGLVQLFELALEAVADRFAADVLVSSDIDERRQVLSQALALIVVSGPVWVLHWWLAGRQLDDAGERASAIRLTYFAAAMAGALLFWFPTAIGLLQDLLGALLDAADVEFSAADAARGLASLLGLTLVWSFHAMAVRVDHRLLMTGAPRRWPFRLYLYGATTVGLIVLTVGATTLAHMLADLTFADDVLTTGQDFWRRDLTEGLSSILVGALIWAGHWLYAARLTVVGGWLAPAEQRSTIRRVYLYGAILLGAFMVLRGFSGSLQEPLRLLFDVSDAPGRRDSVRQVIEPLLVALPFAAIWLVHRHALTHEAEAYAESETQTSLARLYLYLLSLAGLALGAAAFAYLLGILIDLLLGGGRTVSVSDDWWREQIARFAPLALVGATLWLWYWNQVAQRVAASPVDERRALSRRIYLYAVLGAALVAAIISLGVVLYQVFEALFGVVGNSGFIEDTSAAFGVLLVAAALVAFHGLVLRRDLEVQSEAVTAEVRRSLTLIGPPGSDLDDVLDRLRAELPERHRLEERE